VTGEDAAAVIWHELRRLAHLLAELADRVTWLEDHTGDTNGEPDDDPTDDPDAEG
jgi:hypothetical protein